MPTRKRGRALKQTKLTDTIPPSPSAKRSRTSKPQQSGSPIVEGSKRNVVKRSAKLVYYDETDDDLSDIRAISLEPRAQSNVHEVEDDVVASSMRPVAKRRKVRISDSDGDSRNSAGQNREVGQGGVGRKNKTLLERKRKRVQHSSESESDEVEEERILESRLRSRDKKTAFQKNLEKLKRKIQGKAIESSESSSEGSESEVNPFKGAKPSSDRDSLFDGSDSDSAENSSDFIVEDDGSALASLPAEFSMDAHEDFAHQFKKIFQFFVHVAVRPASERHAFMKEQIRVEDYFRLPLLVARRKLSGLRDSMVASSVWRPEFKKALEMRPDFELVQLQFSVPYCDACHLGSRVATLLGRLTGCPYDKFGFEDLDDPGPDSDSGSESEEHKSTGEYHLGRFCARRTRIYHEFSHWEYSLFKCIRQEVDDLHAAAQSKGFLRVSFAAGKPPPEDLGDADGICDWLDERRLIDMEWQKLKDMMESARHLELASKRGDVD